VVVLAQPPHWTIGALINNVWSVAGSGGRLPVNQILLQYFINYNMKKGWYITLQTNHHRKLASEQRKYMDRARR
jgi:hypothetical protein